MKPLTVKDVFNLGEGLVAAEVGLWLSRPQSELVRRLAMSGVSEYVDNRGNRERLSDAQIGALSKRGVVDPAGAPDGKRRKGVLVYTLSLPGEASVEDKGRDEREVPDGRGRDQGFDVFVAIFFPEGEVISRWVTDWTPSGM